MWAMASKRMLRMLAGVAVVALASGSVAAAAEHPAAGVVSQGDLAERDFARMDRGGVETLRFLLRRALVEPAAGAYDWSSVDPVVEAAARHRIELLPVIYGTPPWADPVEAHPPLDTAAERHGWRRFLTALVDRYGPGGVFWDRRVGRVGPIRRWQIWNEPNFDFYWDPRPSAPEYARLVDLAERAVHSVDPRARLLLAGVAAVRSGRPWWSFLRRLYRIDGFRSDLDAVALHPYSPGIRLLARQVEVAREIMRAAGDRRKPLAITEVGWASAGPSEVPLVAGLRGQARLLRRAFELLERHARRWRISDIDWFAWQDSLAVERFCVFCERAGLFDFAGRPKPSWDAFRRLARGGSDGRG
jgi:hypothetical protein